MSAIDDQIAAEEVDVEMLGPEDVLNANNEQLRYARQRSGVWEHFELFNGKTQAACIHCPSVLEYNGSISSLLRHLTGKRHKVEIASIMSAPQLPRRRNESGEYTQAEMREMDLGIMDWMVAQSIPFSKIDCVEFRNMIWGINRGYFNDDHNP